MSERMTIMLHAYNMKSRQSSFAGVHMHASSDVGLEEPIGQGRISSPFLPRCTHTHTCAHTYKHMPAAHTHKYEHTHTRTFTNA